MSEADTLVVIDLVALHSRSRHGDLGGSHHGLGGLEKEMSEWKDHIGEQVGCLIQIIVVVVAFWVLTNWDKIMSWFPGGGE